MKVKDQDQMQDVLFGGIVQILMRILPRIDQLPASGKVTFYYERQGGGAKRNGEAKVRIRGEHTIDIKASGEAVPLK